MKKIKTLNNTMYDRLFEKLWSVALEDDPDDEIIQEVVLEILQEEIMESEPVCGIDEEEMYVTRLSVLNTVIAAFLPGYRLVVEVDEDKGTVGEVYLAEV